MRLFRGYKVPQGRRSVFCAKVLASDSRSACVEGWGPKGLELKATQQAGPTCQAGPTIAEAEGDEVVQGSDKSQTADTGSLFDRLVQLEHL